MPPRSSPPDVTAARGTERDPLQAVLGQRVRRLRARRGVTRKLLAQTADVSERHLANLEAGDGNPSVLILNQIAAALDCSLAELLGDETTDSPEWLLIRDLLHGIHGRPVQALAPIARGYWSAAFSYRVDDEVARWWAARHPVFTDDDAPGPGHSLPAS